jgi:hypothetical protein|uniref:Cargo protein 1 compact domain-containing protein n=1 Tax=CrAss-like virus sp. ctelJ1 TaxID=2825838 RepID=A0A8S5V2J3_9CAUD|nr:MAG TPA: hypothetical protein [CrAss-like virus sp. ctelJ1]
MKDTVLVLDPMDGFISTRRVLPTKRRKNYFKDGGGLLPQIDSSIIDDAFQKSFSDQINNIGGGLAGDNTGVQGTGSPRNQIDKQKLASGIQKGVGVAQGIMNLGLDVLNDQNSLDDSGFINTRQQYESMPINTGSREALINNIVNTAQLNSGIKGGDIDKTTGGQAALGIGSAMASGAAAGSVFGPWGAAIGAAAAGLTKGVSLLFKRKKAKSMAAKQNEENRRTNEALSDFQQRSLDAQDDNDFANYMINFSGGKDSVFAAFGGQLHTNGADFSNGASIIEAGGSHEENPNSGVQIGVDKQGTPNLVEEGEVVYDDYVFSNRLKANDEVLGYANLPLKYRDTPFSDIAKKLLKPSEAQLNDPITTRTLKANMNKLRNAQEVFKQIYGTSDIANQFAFGGNIYASGGQFAFDSYLKNINTIINSDGNLTNEAMTLFMNGDYSGYYDESKVDLAAKTYASYQSTHRGKDYQQAYEERYSQIKSEIEKHLQPLKNRISAAMYLSQRGIRLMPSGKPFGDVPRDIYDTYNDIASGKTSYSQAMKSFKPSEHQTQSNQYSNSSDGNIGVKQEKSKVGDVKPTKKITTKDLAEGRGDNYHRALSPDTIQYNRNVDEATVREYEKTGDYADFIDYVKNTATDKEINEWIKTLESGKYGDLKDSNGKTYKIKGKDDLIRLMTDGKFGPIHHFAYNASRTKAAEDQTPQESKEQVIDEVADKTGTSRPDAQKQVDDYIKANPDVQVSDAPWKSLPTGLRYAPIGSALAGLAMNSKDYSDVDQFAAQTARPNSVRYFPIAGYISPDYVSPFEMSAPIVEQMGATRRAISNASAGNRAQALAALANADKLGIEQLGRAYIQGKAYNSAQKKQAAEFNRATDMFNAQNDMQAQSMNMYLNNYYLNRAQQMLGARQAIDAAYNAARSANLNSLTQSLANIGKQNAYLNMMASNKALGYRMLPDGSIEYKSVPDAIIDTQRNRTPSVNVTVNNPAAQSIQSAPTSVNARQNQFDDGIYVDPTAMGQQNNQPTINSGPMLDAMAGHNIEPVYDDSGEIIGVVPIEKSPIVNKFGGCTNRRRRHC